MKTNVKDWFNDNILEPEMYMWIIELVIAVCVILFICVIISKYKNCTTLALIAKCFLESVKIVVSIGACAYIFLICSLKQLSIATLVVVLLAIIQTFDSIISIIDIVKKIVSNPDK